MKITPIYDDSNDHAGYITKGHVNTDEMLGAIHHQWNDDFNPSHYEHTTMRCIPTPHLRDFDFIYEYSEPGRGAFKCTVAWQPLWS